jgi:hypothetical protein
MRSDRRLSYRDIKARMTAPREMLPTDNVLNMRREREARTPLGLSCWTARRGEVTKAEVERVERWTMDQISYNTTMDIVYSDDSLCHANRLPICLHSKSVGLTNSVAYHLHTFIPDGKLHTPSPRLAAAIGLLYELQDAVIDAGVSSWRDLPPHCMPSSWRNRYNRNKKSEADHDRNDRALHVSGTFNAPNMTYSTSAGHSQRYESLQNHDQARNGSWAAGGLGTSGFDTSRPLSQRAAHPFNTSDSAIANRNDPVSYSMTTCSSSSILTPYLV